MESDEIKKRFSFVKILATLFCIILFIGVAYFLSKNSDKTIEKVEPIKSEDVIARPSWFSPENLGEPLPPFCLKEGESAVVKNEIKGKFIANVLKENTTIAPEAQDYWVNYVSIVKNNKEVRRFLLDNTRDVQKYSSEKMTPCNLYITVSLPNLSDGKLVYKEPKELRQYNYNGDFQIISKGNYYYSPISSPSGRYVFYSEDGDSFDTTSKTKIGIYDSVKNTRREMYLKDDVFKGSFIEGNEYTYSQWSKDEAKLWLTLNKEVQGTTGIVSIAMEDSEVEFYPFSDLPWVSIFAFNPDTGWFVAGDSDISRKCYSEGGMYPHDWNKYFVNLFTGDKQLISAYKDCYSDGEGKWIDDRTYIETFRNGNIKTYSLK